LGNAGVARAVARAAGAFRFPLVVDPVMISKHGLPLMAPEAVSVLVEELIPRAFLVTPNLHEAAALTGFPVRDSDGMRRAAERIHKMGAAAVLVKGGHLEEAAADVLFDGREWKEFACARVNTPHTHGTGCTFSAAITAELALGHPLAAAVAHAKLFITEAIRSNPGLGKGSGPVNHHAVFEK
jgi:hydroxymethylpyrimidine/phosphomethylpyrimidine kinase